MKIASTLVLVFVAVLSTDCAASMDMGLTDAIERRAAPAEPSEAFRAFVQNLRISGVFGGSPPRIYVDKRVIKIGELLDAAWNQAGGRRSRRATRGARRPQRSAAVENLRQVNRAPGLAAECERAVGADGREDLLPVGLHSVRRRDVVHSDDGRGVSEDDRAD